MIKFPDKHSTLYGFSLFASILIEVNIDLLLKIFQINNRKNLIIIISISFVLFYLEMLLILFIFQWSIHLNLEGALYALALTIFIFYLCRSCLPYWMEKE